MEWYDIIVAVLTGLATAIPLVIQLVKYVKQAIKEKNWTDLIELVTNLMKEAEGKFDNGTDRREWCLMMVKATADTINYDIDLNQVGELIDSLTAMSKIVNPPVEEVIEEEIEEVVG